MTRDFDVLVVGGGLAGLTAGATATRAGARTVVLEAHRPGGRARVTVRDGFAFNEGGHALYLGGPGTAVLRALGVEPQGAPPPLNRYRLQLDGHLHRLPASPTAVLSTTALGPRAKAQLSKVLLGLQRTRPADVAGRSVDDVLAERDLRPEVEAVVRALVRISTYSDEHAVMSADAAVVQLRAAAGAGVLYLHGGWAQLVDGLARQVEVREGWAVESLEVDGHGVRATTARGNLSAAAAVVALGTPAAARTLLPGAPDWGDVGPPLTAACLDVAVDRLPDPAWVLSADAPTFVTMQGPPARQAPPGMAMVASIRYGARSADADRAELEAALAVAGVTPETVVHRRFLARMNVVGALPLAANGGLAGRVPAHASGSPRVSLAGDWVGPEGMLADVAFASGAAAGATAARVAERSPSRVA